MGRLVCFSHGSRGKEGRGGLVNEVSALDSTPRDGLVIP
jgi:hypothetical protein